MPPLNLPIFWIIALNVLGWPVIHLTLAWLFIRLPARLFDTDIPTFRFEIALYERLLLIRHWKDLLPDGAAWFHGGFPKARLTRRDPAYRDRFIQECRRSEAAHWTMLLAAPVFYLWNPPWAFIIMLVYGLLANLPCIFTQRYNRIRLLSIQQPRLGREQKNAIRGPRDC